MQGLSIWNRLENFLSNKVWNLRNRSFSPPTSEELVGKDVKIFVVSHRDIELPSVFSDRRVYVPLRVNNRNCPTSRRDWLVDDAGENISQYNELINEITGIWWVAKHYGEIGNPQFVGFDHYRRFLQWKPGMLENGVLVSTSGFYLRKTILELSEDCFSPVFRDKFTNLFSGNPLLLQDLESYLNGHTIYYSNLFITDRTTFFRYFEFLEKCVGMVLDMIQSNAISLDGLSPYKRRIYSFFLEHMTSLWIYHERKRGGIRHITTKEMRFDIPNLENSLT